MTHEKIIKRETGTQYLLKVGIRVDWSSINWEISCWTRQPKKKKWSELPDTIGDYQYRGLSMEDRRKHTAQNILRFVTEEEILTAKLELWQKIKPA